MDYGKEVDWDNCRTLLKLKTVAVQKGWRGSPESFPDDQNSITAPVCAVRCIWGQLAGRRTAQGWSDTEV